MNAEEVYKDKHKCRLSEKRIDRYNYEANCSGCMIMDYDKFERHRITEILLMIGILGLYFFVGLIVGVAIML